MTTTPHASPAGEQPQPKCWKCRKPVERGPNGWRHALVVDYMGTCWWGKPTDPTEEHPDA